jgi:hypothetical protein
MHGQHATTESYKDKIYCGKIGASLGREAKEGSGHKVVGFVP